MPTISGFVQKLTGSSEVLTTSGTNNNILSGQVIEDIVIVNPDTNMTLTINDGDPIFIPAGAGFSSVGIRGLNRINKAVIEEDATNYYWHGYQVAENSNV